MVEPLVHQKGSSTVSAGPGLTLTAKTRLLWTWYALERQTEMVDMGHSQKALRKFGKKPNIFLRK